MVGVQPVALAIHVLDVNEDHVAGFDAGPNVMLMMTAPDGGTSTQQLPAGPAGVYAGQAATS
jgi:hypothetical protein